MLNKGIIIEYINNQLEFCDDKLWLWLKADSSDLRDIERAKTITALALALAGDMSRADT